MWKKERLKDEIYKTLPKDVVIQNLSFFPGKVVVSGFAHISRSGQLKSLEKQLSLKSSWIIKYTLISISGTFNTEILDAIFGDIPRLEINSIDIDQLRRLVSITFQKQPKNFLSVLKNIETKLKITIKVKTPDSDQFLSLLDLAENSSKNSYLDEINNQKIDVQDLKSKIQAVLPSWIKTSKIKIFNDHVEIQTENDLSDLERINFLTLLLESQIGLKIEIKQIYTFENQLQSLDALLKNYFKVFSITQPDLKRETEVFVKYSDFPLTEEVLSKIKTEMFKKTKLVICEFISDFEENSEKICLELKNWIVTKYPAIEYCFVHYNSQCKWFDVLLPEENSSVENLTLDVCKESIEKSGFSYPIQVKWIEEDPVFYLEERLFIGSQKSRLLKIEYDKPKIYIYYKELQDFPFLIWEKLIFRLVRFEITLIDAISGQTKNIFDFKDFIKQLSPVKLTELLTKVIPINIDINKIFFEEDTNKYYAEFANLIKKQQIISFIDKWKSILSIEFEPKPLRSNDEIIYQITSILPEWLVNPKIYFDSDDILQFIVQNDYEDEEQLQKFVSEQSKRLLVPISLKINLTITRIKQIIYQTLEEYIEISRLKIYPEKENIYLEGFFKSDQDEELLEEELTRIESKTKYVIESYIKRKNVPSSGKQSVHDLLHDLLNTYEIIPFKEEHYKEAESIESFDTLKHGIDRIDLRDLDCFSIDPTGTKAVDECISVQRITQPEKEDELLLGIHVSDVTTFVSKDSLLDKEAKRRGFSVYLNHEKTTYNLFPETLIEKMSLIVGNERPALSLFIRISLNSNIEEFFLKKTIIKNKRQFTYKDVNEILIEQKGEFLTDLQLLVSITSQFKSNRIFRGSINLDFMPDNIADQIVSELMITANRLVGFYLQSLPGQKVFRNQHIQSYTYLLLQKNFNSLGYNLDILNKNPLTDINRILQEAAINGESELIMSELRNYLSNAYYSHTCTGHEALGTKWYSQWTSPLRKYMDLVVHRLINKEYVEDLHYLCQYSSAIERLLKIKIDSSLTSFYYDKMQNFITNDYDLTVSLLKLTPRHVIISTDQDFFLFILLPAKISLEDTVMNMLDYFIAELKTKEKIKIKLHNISKEKKDLILNFTPKFELKERDNAKPIKAKIIFLD